MPLDISFENNYFKVSQDGEMISKIEYKLPAPSNLKLCDLKHYSISVLYNTYFNKETDIFKIFIDEKKDCTGYLFPLQSLDGDRTIEDKWEINLSFVAADWILNNMFTEDSTCFLDTVYKTELKSIDPKYNPPILLVINKYEIPDFDIKDYKLSLLLYGYLENSNDRLINNITRNDGFLAGEKKICLKNSKKLTDDKLINIIFNPMIFSSELMPYRFLILYQSIEHMMKETQSEHTSNLQSFLQTADLTDYKILKNVKTEINNLDSEVKILSEIFSKVELLDDYKEDIKLLNSDFKSLIKEDADKSVYKVIYNIRNCLFHYYRAYMEEPSFDKLLYRAFLMIIELLISKYHS